MREARLFHEVGNADSFEASLAESLGRGLDDPFTVPDGLLPGDFHADLLTLFIP